VATFPVHADDSSILVEKAVEKMLRARSSGGNSVFLAGE